MFGRISASYLKWSTQCCVAVWSRWLESATRRVGFRAVKKTLEALYTTKVNNRGRTVNPQALGVSKGCRALASGTR